MTGRSAIRPWSQTQRQRPDDPHIAEAQQALSNGEFEKTAHLLSDAHAQAASTHQLAMDLKQAEALYREALSHARQLAERNPAVFRADVAATLFNLGSSYVLDWKLPDKAFPLLKEASALYQPYAERSPSLFGDEYAKTVILMVFSHPAESADCRLLASAIRLTQRDVFKQLGGELAKALDCKGQ